MKTRRDFIATTIAAAASLTSASGQTAAIAFGHASVNANEAGRQPTGFDESAAVDNFSPQADKNSEGHDMKDRAEDPRIRARLSGAEHVTKDATVARYTHPLIGSFDQNSRRSVRRKQNRRSADVYEPDGYAVDGRSWLVSAYLA